MKVLNYICFISLVSTTFLLEAKEIKINSTPSAAEVWVRQVNSQNFQKIGETPLKSTTQEIINNYTKSKVFIIEVRKPEHSNYRITFSDFSNEDIDLNVKLDLIDDNEQMNKIDDASQSLFEAQRLIRLKNYDQAISKLNDLLKKFPRLSIVHELKGSAYYLGRKKAEALDSYNEAFKFNPKNLDAYKMKLYLEKSITEGSENEKR